jgi:predicted enzyme related to lactoylglutathione lyase
MREHPIEGSSMSERNGYRHGVPCWIETWQPDAGATAGFYARLFGWEIDPAGDTAFMCRLRGRDVAFVGQQPEESADLPAGWATCVWVDSADEVAARVADGGGRVVMAPFETLDGGRMVVFEDPAGALLVAWQPGSHRGAQLVNEANAWSWSQLLTDDPERATAFYGAVFGWETEAFGEATMWRVPGYVGGEPSQPVSRDVVAGMAPLGPDLIAGGVRPHWRIDFWVDDVDATVATATQFGGHAVVPAYSTPFFRQAVVADPRGAVFSVSRLAIAG